MKTLLEHQRGIFAALVIVLASLLGASVASARVNTTLLSEDFSEGYVPPPGWNSDNYSWGASYWSSAGAGDYNGSWVFDLWDCDNDNIYSPTIDLSSYDVNTTVTLDFDMYMEFNYYDMDAQSWSGEGGAQFMVFPDDGSGNFWSNQPLKDLSYTSDNYTYSSGADYQIYDPDVNSGSWRHYTITIPSQYYYSTFRLVFMAQPYWNCNGGNIAIDNVVVTASLPQNINFTPGVMDFGAVESGQQSTPQCVTLTNTSTAPVDISSIYFVGPDADEFALSGTVPTSIPANSDVDVCVQFNPNGNGNRSAKLIVNNTSDNYASVSVDVKGLAQAPVIQLIPVGAHNTTTKMFFTTTKRLGDTLEQTMLLQNIGAGDLHILPATSITGDFPGEYFISQLPVAGVPAGSIDTIRVKFTPTIEGLHGAKLNIISDAANGTQVVNLDGVGVLPKIVVTPDPLRFDSTKIGDTVCTSVTVYNPGSDTLKLKNQVITSNEGDFKIGLLTAEFTSIPPDKSRDISICFIPKQAGSREARLTLFTNIPRTFDSPRLDTGTIVVAIGGTGVPYGSLAIINGKSGVDSTIVGTQICRVDTIWNIGSADITVKNIGISGSEQGDFNFSGVSFPLVIHPKSYVVVNVCATPSARGLRRAQLTVNGTSTDSTVTSSIPLVVYGQLVCAAPNPQALFLDTKVLKSTDSVQCVEVTNCGDVATVYNAQVSNTTYYSVTPAQSALIQPGQTVDFCVHFNPTVTGEQDAKLVITAPNLADVNVDLKGVGACANLTSQNFVVPVTNAGGHSTFAITIDNTGNYDYVLGTPVLTQPASDSAYRIISPVPTTVPAGGNVQITIGYDPSKTQTTYTGSLSFPNGGPCTENTPGLNWSQTTGTESVSQQTEQSGFVLEQNYPNPASSQTSFSFTTPREAAVTVTLSDLTGHAIRTLINGRVSEGAHVVTLDASTLASGTYVYTLQSDGVRLSRLLVLTK
ncbi:MAG: choice-of-anchor D domain-containing protein [Bacteroidetes bacterium]|nr:choice-of-anchor D domain-containing protein [Bacteroidota bacterium]